MALRTLPRPGVKLGHIISPWTRPLSTTISRLQSDPLRILFCGSDEFSCASLRAVSKEYTYNRELIESLDVMVLPPKRVGRGYKSIREVPCKTLAEELGLRIHQRETFTKWEIPEGTNLIVAVSFGLFVPPRILRAAKYGGLNVHPSLLPDLRGPAPIHHAILRGCQHTGVSLQTLDDKAFDHGTILAQSPFPGISIPPGSTVQELTNLLAPVGAQMLVQGLRNGVHIPPFQQAQAGWMAKELDGEPLAHAPKLTKADAQIDWRGWGAEDFVRRIQVLSSVWTHAINRRGDKKRLLIQDAELATDKDAIVNSVEVLFVEISGGERQIRHERSTAMQNDGSCLLQVSGEEWIKIRKIKEEGKPERDAAVVLRSYQHL